MIELLIVMAISTVVLGSAVLLSGGVQKTAAHQFDDAAVQQEARFALDWIRRTVISAGSNPYRITTSACPAAGTPFVAIRLDPDGNGLQDDIRIQGDVNPPNGQLIGVAGACNEPGEDVTIAHDPLTRTLTRRDAASDTTPVAVTDSRFTNMTFSYLTAGRVATTNPAAIAYVRVSLTAQSSARNPSTGGFTSFTFNSEIRLRSR